MHTAVALATTHGLQLVAVQPNMGSSSLTQLVPQSFSSEAHVPPSVPPPVPPPDPAVPPVPPVPVWLPVASPPELVASLFPAVLGLLPQPNQPAITRVSVPARAMRGVRERVERARSSWRTASPLVLSTASRTKDAKIRIERTL